MLFYHLIYFMEIPTFKSTTYSSILGMPHFKLYCKTGNSNKPSVDWFSLIKTIIKVFVWKFGQPKFVLKLRYSSKCSWIRFVCAFVLSNWNIFFPDFLLLNVFSLYSFSPSSSIPLKHQVLLSSFNATFLPWCCSVFP